MVIKFSDQIIFNSQKLHEMDINLQIFNSIPIFEKQENKLLHFVSKQGQG